MGLLVNTVVGTAIIAPSCSSNSRTDDAVAGAQEWTQGATRVEMIRLPPGFEREAKAPGSFASFLRQIPLKKSQVVRLFNGKAKANQGAHLAILDVDVGKRDLQQCADSAIRLRAEYLFAQDAPISFRFESGHAYSFAQYREGLRPVVQGSKVSFEKKAQPSGATHASLLAYLDWVFMYASTRSLARDLGPRPVAEMSAGDIFVEPRTPLGHAVIVLDTAREASTGRRVFLLAQGSTPAQDMEVLVNPKDGSPWFSSDFGSQLVTPEWIFRPSHLRAF